METMARVAALAELAGFLCVQLRGRERTLARLLSAAGRPVLPIEDSQLEALITSGLTVAASLAAWWKNNSFTPAAIRADAALKAARRP